jgi:hypothetical protein
MRTTSLAPLLLAVCGSVDGAAPLPDVCWVSDVELSSKGVASIRFTEQARGFGAIVASDNGSKALSNFQLAGETVIADAKRTKVLLLRQGKIATFSAGHESCKLEWSEDGGKNSLKLSGTSTYVSAGATPHTVTSFVPLVRKGSKAPPGSAK